MTTVLLHKRSEHPRSAPKDLRRAAQPRLNHPHVHRRRKATSLVIPELKGKIDGVALRVPTPTSRWWH